MSFKTFFEKLWLKARILIQWSKIEIEQSLNLRIFWRILKEDWRISRLISLFLSQEMTLMLFFLNIWSFQIVTFPLERLEEVITFLVLRKSTQRLWMANLLYELEEATWSLMSLSQHMARLRRTKFNKSKNKEATHSLLMRKALHLDGPEVLAIEMVQTLPKKEAQLEEQELVKGHLK